MKSTKSTLNEENTKKQPSGKMPFTGERVVFDMMQGHGGDYDNLLRHIERYFYAMRFVLGKTVIDAACGTCYGSFLLSLGAKHVFMADKDLHSIAYGQRFPFGCETDYKACDLETDLLPEADVCVSFETIEHLSGDGFFLKNLKCKELIFSFPLKSPSQYHKLVFKYPEDGQQYIESCGWKVEEMKWQFNEMGEIKYVYGRATRTN